MKSIFRNLKSLALVAVVGFAALAVSCGEDPIPTDPVYKAYEFVDGNSVLFDAGEVKTVAVKEGQSLAGATVVSTPAGWTVTATDAALEITAPTQESVDAESAEAYGYVVVRGVVDGTNYEGELGVCMGEIIEVEAFSSAFNDVAVKAVVATDNYLVHLGTNAEWKDSFDEWKNSAGGWNPIEFGWAGEYYGIFEGSLFTFAKSPYKSNFKPTPGTKYQLAILPLVEGKDITTYAYSDVYLFDFETAEAGENGSVTPQFTLASKTHKEVIVTISAPDAYMTFYTFYSANEYEGIAGRDNVIKSDLLKNGNVSNDAEITARKDGLAENAKVYLAAYSIDNNGNFGQLVVEEFSSDIFKFNEEFKVALGEITCSDDGKTVYIPVSAEGGEVDHYRCAYISSGNTSWTTTYGGTVEKAEIYIATAPNEYYGPKFYYPEGTEILGEDGQPKAINTLVDGQIVVKSGPWPGSEARILVLAMGKDGLPSHAEYVESYIPRDSSFVVIEEGDANYEFGMPTVTYVNVVSEVKNGVPCWYVNFDVKFAEGTATAWVAVAGEEYIAGRSATALVKEMIDEGQPFMGAKKFTGDGVFKGDSMYMENTEERNAAVYVTWLDTDGNYHETQLMYGPVADAQDDLKAAGAFSGQ